MRGRSIYYHPRAITSNNTVRGKILQKVTLRLVRAMRAVFAGILRNARSPCLLTGLPTGKASLEVGRRAIGVAVGFDHKPSDNLDLLNVPRRVDHHHVGQYEAMRATG